MKKLVLLLTTCIIATGVNAQEKRVFNTKEAPLDVKMVRSHGNDVKATANKTTLGGSRWYNAAESTGEYAQVDIYDPTLDGLYLMWQDSSVRYDAPSNNRGINYLSIGQVFHPQSPLFNDFSLPSNAGKIAVQNSNAYVIDSIRLRGRYERISNNYVDTLIFTLVPETATGKFAYFSYGGSVFADHGVDSFAAQLYRDTFYMIAPINQISYSSTSGVLGSSVQFKVPLNNAVWADSNASGYHTIRIAPNMAMPAGTKVSLSVTFKSGTNYTAGSPASSYNFFAFESHETVANGFVFYYPGDLNQSSIVYKDTTYAQVNSTLNMYVPAIAWTAPYGPELHNIAWKVTCPTCLTTNQLSVNEVGTISSASAYPNPANTELRIPVTLAKSSDVTVSLINTLGQVVATKNLGKVAAGQSVAPTFSTAKLAAGTYVYMVNASGEKKSGIIVVAH